MLLIPSNLLASLRIIYRFCLAHRKTQMLGYTIDWIFFLQTNQFIGMDSFPSLCYNIIWCNICNIQSKSQFSWILGCTNSTFNWKKLTTINIAKGTPKHWWKINTIWFWNWIPFEHNKDLWIFFGFGSNGVDFQFFIHHQHELIFNFPLFHSHTYLFS